MKAGALFSGIGGFCLGFENAGIRTAWAVEFDEHAAETYSHNLPEARLLRKDTGDQRLRSDPEELGQLG